MRPFTYLAPKSLDEALQVLAKDNGEVLLGRVSRAVAERLSERSPEDASGRVYHLYAITYGRPPNEAELAQSLAFLEAATNSLQAEQQDQESAQRDSWEALCHVVLSSSEFLHIR